jgi:hypothetical protein
MENMIIAYTIHTFIHCHKKIFIIKSNRIKTSCETTV